jgi:hypothetical protein
MAYLMSQAAKRTIILGCCASGKTTLAQRSGFESGPTFRIRSDVRGAFDALVGAPQILAAVTCLLARGCKGAPCLGSAPMTIWISIQFSGIFCL